MIPYFSNNILEKNVFWDYVQNLLDKVLFWPQIRIQRLKIHRHTMFIEKFVELFFVWLYDVKKIIIQCKKF